MSANDKQALPTAFDEVAELYDRIRPGYPAQLFDDLFSCSSLTQASTVLEIGCDTGQATARSASFSPRLPASI